MLFRGISFRLLNETEKQEQALEILWAFFVANYSVQDIRVLVYNRTKNYIEFVFGLTDNGDIGGEFSFAENGAFLCTGLKEVLVPEKGWITDGVLTSWDGILTKEGLARNVSYQIVEGTTDGLQVKHTTQYPDLERLQLTDLDGVMRLYHMALGSPGCVWNENYPDRELISQDLQAGDLYGIRNAKGEVIAAVAKDRDEEVDSLPFWTREYAPGAELARLVVHKRWKNQGLARVLHIQMQKELAKRGFHSVHFLVAEVNEPARRSYEALEYSFRGETDLFGHHYFCYEKSISETEPFVQSVDDNDKVYK